MEHQGVRKYSIRNAFAFQENLSTRRKTSWSTVENQQQTQLTYDAGSRNRTLDTLVGGEPSHHCGIHIGLKCFQKSILYYNAVATCSSLFALFG